MGNDTSAALQYKISDFEGPLDMLLQLIAKHKMDICDIEIAVLLEQYMEQIKDMQSGQMEVSSEFLEMAARLVNGKRLLRRSKSNPSRYKAIGKVDGEFWVVVLEKDLYTVVTARRAHKDEEVLWKNLK